MNWFGQTKRLLFLEALLLCPIVAFGQQPVNLVDGGTATKDTVKPAATGATANDSAIVTTLSPQSGIPLLTPKGNNKTLTTKTVSVASVTVTAHQTIIVTIGSGNTASSNWAIACSDGTNTYYLDVSNTGQATAYTGICRAPNVAAGTYTITVTASGSSSANSTMQMEVYAADGLLLPASALDQSRIFSGSSTAGTTSLQVTPLQPNELAFSAFSVASNSTVTATGNWTADYTSADSVLSFGSLSQLLPNMNGLLGTATFGTTGAWSVSLATYRSTGWNQGTTYVEGLVVVNSVSPVQQAAASGAVVPAMGDNVGRQVTVANCPRQSCGESVLNSASSSLVTFIAAQGSGLYADITSLIITNESATATVVSLSDGTTVRKYALAANGGMVAPFNPPKKAASSNTAWQVSNSAAVTLDYEAQWFTTSGP